MHNLPCACPRPGAHVARAALAILAAEQEVGHVCRLSMRYSAAPVLRAVGAIAREWLPRVCSDRDDPAFRPAAGKQGVLVGMAMTEKQGFFFQAEDGIRALYVTGVQTCALPI